MEKKYVATIMERNFISQDNYTFKSIHAIVGDYDEEHQLFTDVNGNEYPHMLSTSALDSDNPYSVYNIKTIKEMEGLIKSNNDLDHKVSEYEDYCQGIFYYVGYNDEYEPFVYPINMDKITDEENDKKDASFDGETTIIKILNDLIHDALDDKYSKKELAEIIKKVSTIEDESETTKCTLETKLMALINNRSFVEQVTIEQNSPVDVTKPITPKIPEPSSIPPIPTLPVDKTPDQTVKINKPAAKIEKKKEIKQKEIKKEIEPVIKEKTKYFDIDDAFNKITKTLIAQDEPLRRMLTELARKEMCPERKRQGILIAGSTGSGKTKMMELAAERLGRKFLIVDSSQLTAEGYVGKDIEKVVWDLYVKCNKDKELTENAVVYFDEIDKKGTDKNGDVNGRDVLNILLKFIEGSTYDAAPSNKSSNSVVEISTANMIIILGGAFTEVYDHIASSTIGFSLEKESKRGFRKATPDDFKKYGQMPAEIMGRVSVIELNPLDKEDLKRILLESDESAIRVQEKIFEELGVKITFTDDFIDRVAEKSYLDKTGARGLNSTVDEATWEVFGKMHHYKTQENLVNPYSEVIMTRDSVDDYTKYELVEKPKQKIKK